MRVIKRLVSELTNVEKGLWYTIRELTLRPGQVVMDYWRGVTRPYISPFRYLLIMAAISAFISLQFDIFEQQYSSTYDFISDITDKSERQAAMQYTIQQKIKSFLHLIPILMLPFSMLASRWLFRRRGNTYAEHLSLVTLQSGHAAFYSIFMMIMLAAVLVLISYSFYIGIVLAVLIFAQMYTRAYIR